MTRSTTEKPPTRIGMIACFATAMSVLSAHPSTSRAQPPQRETREEAQQMADSLFAGAFAIDDANPEASVPSVEARNAAPLEFATFIMELSERADRAKKRGDNPAAVKYYRALTRSVPERAIGYSQLCSAYEAVDARAQAIEACANALGRNGVTLADFSHYVRLVLAERGEISPARLKDLDALMQHLKLTAHDSLVPAQLRCDMGVRLLDVQRLTECTASLRELAPNDPKTLGYEWTLALRSRNYAAAAAIVEQAKHSVMRPDAVQVMERVTREVASPWRRVLPLIHSNAKLAVGALALLLLILAIAKKPSHRSRNDMKNAKVLALIALALAAGPITASAQTSVLSLAGSDSWEPVIRQGFLQTSSRSQGADLSAFLGYSGGGQTPGETALKNNAAGNAGALQTIAFFTGQLTDASISTANNLCPANPNAQDIVIGVDGILNVGKAVNFTAGNPQLSSLGSSNGFNAISILYTGYDFTNPGAGNDCNGTTRRNLLADYSSLFSSGGPGQTTPTTAIRHIYRRGDASATSKSFLALLGLPTANQKYCNGTDFQDLDPIRRNAGPTDQVAEFDGTLGVVLSILVPTFSNNIPDLYTGSDGTQPAFLGAFDGGQAPTCAVAPSPIDPSSAAPGAAAHPYAGLDSTGTFVTTVSANQSRCDCRYPVPVNFPNPAAADAQRFNWNQRIGGTCPSAQAANAPFWNVLNGDNGSTAASRENTPVGWGTRVGSAGVPGLPNLTQRCCNATGVAGDFRREDPRLLNLFVRQPVTGNLQPSVTAPIIAYYRIATTNKGLTSVGQSGFTPRCQQTLASDLQVSCLVTNVPNDNSSIGYGALPVYKDAVTAGLPKPTAFNGNTNPTGTSDSFSTILDRSYQLSRYVFLSSLKGFANLGESAAANTGSFVAPYNYNGSPGSTPGTAQQQLDAQWNLAKAIYNDSRPTSLGARNSAAAVETFGFLALNEDPYAIACTDDANSPSASPGSATTLAGATKIPLNNATYFAK